MKKMSEILGSFLFFLFFFCFDHSVQSKKVENIIKKYWSILKRDIVLSNVWPPHPKFIYRKAPALKSILAQSVVDASKKKSSNTLFPSLVRFHYCGKCKACKTSRVNSKKENQFVATATEKLYKIKDFITKGVVYMLEYFCGIQYMGGTTRQLYVLESESICRI